MFFNKYITLSCGTRFKISEIQTVRILRCILNGTPEGLKVVMTNGRWEDIRYLCPETTEHNYNLLMDAL